MRQTNLLIGLGLLLALAIPAIGEEDIREIFGNSPPGWNGAQSWRHVPIASAHASSTFAPESGQYSPARAVDGNRNTKWVASIAPSQESPQWITLELFGAPEVSAVVVRGERIDNDGILEARVEVTAAPGQPFTTVVAVPDAKSNLWMAGFEPVKASAVRLSILRSGGPSPHTDVYEITVLGPPLSAEQAREFTAERLAECREQLRRLAEMAAELNTGTGPQSDPFQAAVTAVERQCQQLSAQVAQWEKLDSSTQQALTEEVQQLFVRIIMRLMPGVKRAAAIWPARVHELVEIRNAATQAETQNVVTCSHDGGELRIGNNLLSVVIDEADGVWNATWLGGLDAAMRRIRFAVAADGQILVPTELKTEVFPLSDAIGRGQEVRQRWSAGIEVERTIRVYDGRPMVVVAGRIVNRTDHDVSLGAVHLLQLSSEDQGWWHVADFLQAPAGVGFPGATPPCRPAPDEEDSSTASQQYSSNGVLALVPRNARAAMAMGFLSARAGSPHVAAQFQAGEGGTAMDATLSCGGKKLRSGESFSLDAVWLSVEEDGFRALEHYGDAAATFAVEPVRTGANALWCSWYPIRMTISEEIALAHAAIAAQHFKPLGLDVIQLDHGWQRGDICGDWTANERFPHGLAWLADELRTRYGMKLGLWIAPTQVASTSQLYQDHPDWLLTGADGRPASVGRWYWVPNPDMAVLDASHAEAEQWIADTFAHLTAAGASYYKIDFIAGSPSLDKAMAAIRRGAGPDAWIRYCQTPPLLSAGLASSAYIGDDTGDAGLPDWFELERRNAPLLAASYWANDRLYHREVCDMSVGTQADVEEARFKMTLMTLGGCSISFSDDFRSLDLPRIRMMQQCLPPGNPPARPLDLFERELPSMWHMHCAGAAGQWDAVGLFNFADQPQERTVDLAALGLPAGSEVVAFEFWEERYLGTHTEQVTLTLAPRTARIVLIRPLPTHPQLIATNMHVLGGYHEVTQLAWDESQLQLTGQYQRAPGLTGKSYFCVPDRYRPILDTSSTGSSGRLTHAIENIWIHEVDFEKADLDWSISFERAAP